MKKNLLVPCCALFIAACGSGGSVGVSDGKPLGDEGVNEVRLEKVSYGTFDEFYSSIVFKDGVSPAAEYKDQIFYDSLGDDGIKELMPRDFYQKNKKDEEVLEDKLAELGESTQVFPLGPEHTPVSAQIHSRLWAADEEGIGEVKDRIEALKEKATKDLTKEEAQELAYGHSLLAQYSSANKVVSEVCKDKEKCVEKIRLNLMGRVVDDEGAPLEGAQIQLLNQPNNKNAKVLTDAEGNAKISVVVRNPEKIRVRVSKSGYSDAFMDDYVVMELDPEYNLEFTRKLFAAHGSAELDLSKGAQGIIKTEGVTIEYKDDAFELQTEGDTKYTIEKGQIKKPNGKPHNGKVTMEVFDFIDQAEIMDEFLRADIISEDWINIENQFITFGMPYFTVRDGEGNQLEVTKDNPLRLETNYNKLPGLTGVPAFFTADEWKALVQYSNDSGEELPLTRETIAEVIGREYDPARPWATWWVLRRDTGVWEPSPFKLLNEEGDMIAESYTIE